MNPNTLTLSPETTKFRLGIIGVDYGIPFDLGRCRGPLLDMSRQDKRLEIIEAPANALHGGLIWPWLNQCDAVYFQNPVAEHHAEILSEARLMNVPFWADWGDDFFTLPPTHRLYPQIAGDDNLVQHIEWIVENAAVATISTVTARSNFPAKVQGRILIMGDYTRWKPSERRRKKIITWRGMGTHAEDLQSVLPDILDIARDPALSDWAWLLFGEPPQDFLHALSQAVGEPWVGSAARANKRLLVSKIFASPYWYAEVWSQWAPFLHICPLADTPFNKTKTPNAWLEASAVGAGVIGPNFPEWNHCAGLITYDQGVIGHNGKRNFGTVLREELAKWDDGKMHPNVELARAEIFAPNSDYTVKGINRRRWAILRKLASLSRDKEETVLDAQVKQEVTL